MCKTRVVITGLCFLLLSGAGAQTTFNSPAIGPPGRPRPQPAQFLQIARTANLMSPANGATVSTQVQFQWTPVARATSYVLWVGTSPGTYNILNFSTTSLNTTAILQPETTYYVTLWTVTRAGSASTTSTFNTNNGAPQLQSPATGAKNVSQFQQFTWSQVPNALLYILLVSPTNFNAWDNFGEDIAPTVLGEYVWGLQPNTYYYATMCVELPSGYLCSYSNFTTGSGHDQYDKRAFYNKVQNLTGQVRLMASETTNVPATGTFLYQSMLNHSRPPSVGASCGDFATALAQILTQNRILTRVRQTTLNGADGHIIPEYWDPFNNNWTIADPTFGVVYFDPSSDNGQGVEDINSFLLAGNLSSITPTWVTPNGSSYMTGYYLDPITYYNNPYPFGNNEDYLLVLANVPNSPLPYLTPSSLSAQGTPGTYIFLFANQSDQITITSGSYTVTIAPRNPQGWGGSVVLPRGWSISTPIPDGLQIYTPHRVLF